MTPPAPSHLAALRASFAPGEADPFRTDPAGWVVARTGEYLWSKQVEILTALAEHRRVAVKSSHGTGKSFTAGRAVAHWLDVHPEGEAFAVTTAPTAPQVSAILWREIRRAHKRGKLSGRVVGGNGNEEWKTAGGELIAMGRKPADHDPDGFQGIHDRWVLVVLDEAGGIPRSLWTATDTIVTNEDSRILAIGNPDHPLSEFAEVCAGAPEDGTSGISKQGWYVITISTFDTPNFTGEVVPDAVRPMLPSRVWLDDVTRRWGKDSPLYTSKVLGRFPADASDGVIPWSWLQQCRGEEATARVGGLRVPVELGVDVAASDAGDETVVAARFGPRASGDFVRLRTPDSEVIVDAVVRRILETGATSVKVDHTGVGFGVTGSLRRRCPREVRWPVDVHAVVVQETSTEPDLFENVKAEMWWALGREWSRERRWDLSELGEEVLLELAAPRYSEVRKRVRVESKAEVKKRIGRSTDNADAVLLAFYEPPSAPVVTSSSYRDDRLRGRR